MFLGLLFFLTGSFSKFLFATPFINSLRLYCLYLVFNNTINPIIPAIIYISSRAIVGKVYRFIDNGIDFNIISLKSFTAKPTIINKDANLRSSKQSDSGSFSTQNFF